MTDQCPICKKHREPRRPKRASESKRNFNLETKESFFDVRDGQVTFRRFNCCAVVISE